MSVSLHHRDTLAEFVEKPDRSRAIEYQNQNSLRKCSDSGEFTLFPVFSTKLSELSPFGVGLHLYFHLIKSLCVLFFLISLISVWPMIINSRGQNISDDMDKQHGYNVLSIANESGDDNKWNRSQIFIADLVYTGLFIVFLLVYRISSQSIFSRSAKKTHNLSTYAIAVKKLPQDCTPNEVKTHFQQFGEVVEVHFARKYNDTLYDYRKRTDLSYQLGVAGLKAKSKGKTESSSMKLLKIRIRKFDQRIAKKEKSGLISHEKLPVDRAYVVFSLVEDKEKCIREYSKEKKWWRPAKAQRKELQLKEQYPLHVKSAPEPSTILWENLEVTWCKKLIRTIFISLVTLVLLIGSVALLFWLKGRESDLPSSQDCKITYGITQETSFNSTAFLTESQIDCFCLTRSLANVISGEQVCDNLKCVKLNNYCSEFLSKWTKAVYTKILSCFGIIAINFFLLVILKLLTAIERPPTMDKMKLRLLNKVFIAMFVNTTIITVLVNADFQRYVNTRGVFDGKYDDFVEGWYITVGSTLVVTLFINVFSPHGINLLLLRTIRLLRRCCCWRYATSQQELNTLFVGPEFDLAVKTAVVLNLVFSCFLYSGGLPILNCFCFVGLFCIYWVDKYLVLRYYHKPPVYNEMLNAQAMNFLPISVILHCAVSLYMYGSDSDFPPRASTIGQRIVSTSGLLLILWMIIAIGIGFFSFIVVAIYACLRGGKSRKDVKPSYPEVIDQLKQRGLSSYNILDNEVYSPLIHAMSSAYIHTRQPPEVTALSELPGDKSDATRENHSRSRSDTDKVEKVIVEDEHEDEDDIEVKVEDENTERECELVLPKPSPSD